MQRHRFYAPPSCIFNSHIQLDRDEAHHLQRVLRLLPGAVVYAFDGDGSEYECEVVGVKKDAAQLKILARLGNEVESPLELTLGQAMIKGDKFDLVVQKATELGVTRIVPLITEHSEFKKAEGRQQRLQRWQRIALEATKQCGRRKLTEIAEPQNFSQFCEENQSDLRLIFSELKGNRLVPQQRAASVAILIGPEGGWSQSENGLAETHGFVPVHLGARILRTETAALVAVALAQFQFGDLG